MKSSRIIIAGAVLAGVALLVVAGIYFGALALFVFAWFATGPRKAAASA
jgi:hypothetical protein